MHRLLLRQHLGLNDPHSAVQLENLCIHLDPEDNQSPSIHRQESVAEDLDHTHPRMYLISRNKEHHHLLHGKIRLAHQTECLLATQEQIHLLLLH